MDPTGHYAVDLLRASTVFDPANPDLGNYFDIWANDPSMTNYVHILLAAEDGDLVTNMPSGVPGLLVGHMGMFGTVNGRVVVLEQNSWGLIQGSDLSKYAWEQSVQLIRPTQVHAANGAVIPIDASHRKAAAAWMAHWISSYDWWNAPQDHRLRTAHCACTIDHAYLDATGGDQRGGFLSQRETWGSPNPEPCPE